ncbi:hypothetical protein [Erwinia phage Virsaitis27]|nr:hypothetical protein [Erwinia phage Virsaitis27]
MRHENGITIIVMHSKSGLHSSIKTCRSLTDVESLSQARRILSNNYFGDLNECFKYFPVGTNEVIRYSLEYMWTEGLTRTELEEYLND